MRKLILFLVAISLLTTSACKGRKTMSDKSAPKGTYTGIVSFKYKADGCTSVIIMKTEDGGESVLIPKDKLDSKFDKDGLEIYFDYTGLRMPNPEGCVTGIPAAISNISIK